MTSITMHRRDFLRCTCASALAVAEAVGAQQDDAALESAARDAWIYCLPLIEMAGARQLLLQRTPANTMAFASELTTVESQRVTTPNNDTLYARAWLDLSGGPVTLTLPASGSRYLSVALMDMYSNNFAVLGTRTTGPEGGTFTVVGPQHATREPLALRSPTRWVWLLGRTLVDGSQDLAAADRMQRGVTLRAASAPGALRAAVSGARRDAPWGDYFATAAPLLADNPPPVTNWLPAPQDKPFSLVLRAYLPREELRNGAYRLPPLQAA